MQTLQNLEKKMLSKYVNTIASTYINHYLNTKVHVAIGEESVGGIQIVEFADIFGDVITVQATHL